MRMIILTSSLFLLLSRARVRGCHTHTYIHHHFEGTIQPRFRKCQFSLAKRKMNIDTHIRFIVQCKCKSWRNVLHFKAHKKKKKCSSQLQRMSVLFFACLCFQRSMFIMTATSRYTCAGPLLMCDIDYLKPRTAKSNNCQNENLSLARSQLSLFWYQLLTRQARTHARTLMRSRNTRFK